MDIAVFWRPEGQWDCPVWALKAISTFEPSKPTSVSVTVVICARSLQASFCENYYDQLSSRRRRIL